MTEILVLDDDEGFVKALTGRLRVEHIPAVGYTKIADFTRAARAGKLRNVGLMFFDMDLGPQPKGGRANAADVIPIARTYAPAANILVFTHKGIALEDCIECVELGALGLIPKSSTDQLMLAARVYPYIGDRERTTEALIKALWEQLPKASANAKGPLFEMLVANLLSTVRGLTFIGNNWNMQAGEIDLLFENQMEHLFWKKLDSLYFIAECKNTKDSSETKDFSIFREKIRAKVGCKIGIMVSWKKVSEGFRRRQQDDDQMIFLLDRDNLAEMISMPSASREPYLRELFNKQG